jgi:uncharacterized Zn finger protein
MPTGPRKHRRLRAAFSSLLGRLLEPEPAVGETGAEETLRCPRCGDPSICPIHWEARGEVAWWIGCRCGNCGACVEAIVSNRHAAALDVALARQVDTIRRAADALEFERTER